MPKRPKKGAGVRQKKLTPCTRGVAMGAKEEPMLFAEHRGKGEITDVLFIDDITDAIAG